jgi:hypothetical protein
MANPQLEQNADAPPEQLLIQFVQADVLVLGCGLYQLEQKVQKSELQYVTASDLGQTEVFRTLVAKITIQFRKEVV